MDKKINILIGVPGSGKSTYIKNRLDENMVVVSSDETRKFLFGDLVQDNNEDVFKCMFDKVKAFILDNKNNTCFYDATNLSRKRRSHFYRTMKEFANKHKINLTIYAIPILKSLQTCIDQNNKRDGKEKLPVDVIKRMYKQLQIPRIGVDCDLIWISTENFSHFEKEFESDTPHNTPWHKESVKEHLEMCKELALNENDSRLILLAERHDLGKFICKEIGENGIAKYKHHANVGAMYEFARHGNVMFFKNDIISEVIFWHMDAHNKISKKTIKKNKLTNDELDLIEKLRKIDETGRISDMKQSNDNNNKINEINSNLVTRFLAFAENPSEEEKQSYIKYLKTSLKELEN